MLIKKYNQKGLTLVETTIALGIIMLGVLASLILLTVTFNFAQRNEQEIVIVNLAREGVEIVRSLRNSGSIDLFDGTYDSHNFIVDSDANFNLDTSVGSTIDYDISDCTSCTLYLSGGRYLHEDTGDATIFKRIVRIRDVNSNEKKITSEIQWQHKGKTHDFLLETHFTNWVDELQTKLFNQ